MMILSKAVVLSQLCAVASATSLRSETKSRGSDYPWSGNRIIGGTEAEEGRYSYAVSLQNGNSHFCGGSLIAENLVLTAAHCAQSRAGYKAVVARHDLRNRDGYEAIVERQILHPRYNSQKTDNDLMILILDRDIAGVNLVEVSPDFITRDVAVTVMGWGDTNQADYVQALATELMETEVFTLSNSECERSSGSVGGQDIFGFTIGGYEASYINQITDNMICAWDQGEDSCQGDSGGPMVVRLDSGDVQVGVVSWGMGCADADFPGVYARISSNYDFIKENVCDEGSNAPVSFGCGPTDTDAGSVTARPPTPPPIRPSTPRPTPQRTPRPTPQRTRRPTPAPTRTPPTDTTTACNGIFVFGMCFENPFAGWFD